MQGQQCHRPRPAGRLHQHWPHRAQQQRAAATLAPRNEEAGAAKAAP